MLLQVEHQAAGEQSQFAILPHTPPCMISISMGLPVKNNYLHHNLLTIIKIEENNWN